MPFMTKPEIDAFKPEPLPGDDIAPIDHARHAMEAAGYWNPRQQMGRRWPIGCVALEITQRCNLDCTLCYLSENSEAVHDLPLEEVFRRIELIHRYYGRNTDVQITGGAPTLRTREELLAIVRRVRDLGMRPTLMTNGIRATRPLLEELVAAGLVDVSFHVDTTQRIKGYASEAELNEIRQTYIDRTKGLPLSVLFTTTIHRGNFEEIPDLVRFFRANAGAVRTASFQLAADTGRGVDRNRGVAITPESVARQIEAGAGTTINFLASLVGHSACNRYGMCIEAGGKLFDAFDDDKFIGRMSSATADLVLRRNGAAGVAMRFVRWLVVNPAYVFPVIKWMAVKAWQMRGSLVAAKGRINTLSFMIHNFMDSCALERDRIDACVFKIMTADGPVSMCLHNAKRDSFILKPVKVLTPEGEKYWQPLTGAPATATQPAGIVTPGQHGLKRLKGRSRQDFLRRRSA